MDGSIIELKQLFTDEYFIYNRHNCSNFTVTQDAATL